MIPVKIWKNIILDSKLSQQYLYGPVDNDSHNVVILLTPFCKIMKDYSYNVMRSRKIFHYFPLHSISHCNHEYVIKTKCKDNYCGLLSSFISMYAMVKLIHKYQARGDNILLYSHDNMKNVTIFVICCMLYDTPNIVFDKRLNLPDEYILYLNYFSQFITGYNIEYTKIRLHSRDNSPYQIIDVAKVADTNIDKGWLSISRAPGKKDNKHNRDLPTDLNIIKESGIDIIVCLLEWSEIKILNIEDYPRKAQEQGIIFYHLPVKDRGSPNQKDIALLIPSLVENLLLGKNILIHCRCGLGRAGTISACCLCHFGFTPQEAISCIRRNNPGAIQTHKQETTINTYYNSLIH